MVPKGVTQQGRYEDEWTPFTWVDAVKFWAATCTPLGTVLLLWYICW